MEHGRAEHVSRESFLVRLTLDGNAPHLPTSKYNWLTESYVSQNGLCWFDVSSNRSWLCFSSYRSSSSSSSSSFTSSWSSSSSVSYESWLRLLRHRLPVDATTIADVDDAAGPPPIVICLFCLWLLPFSFRILSAISLLVASSIGDAMWLCLNKCDMCMDEGGVSFGFLFVNRPTDERNGNKKNKIDENKWLACLGRNDSIPMRTQCERNSINTEPSFYWFWCLASYNCAEKVVKSEVLAHKAHLRPVQNRSAVLGVIIAMKNEWTKWNRRAKFKRKLDW